MYQSVVDKWHTKYNGIEIRVIYRSQANNRGLDTAPIYNYLFLIQPKNANKKEIWFAVLYADSLLLKYSFNSEPYFFLDDFTGRLLSLSRKYYTRIIRNCSTWAGQNYLKETVIPMACRNVVYKPYDFLVNLKG